VRSNDARTLSDTQHVVRFAGLIRFDDIGELQQILLTAQFYTVTHLTHQSAELAPNTIEMWTLKKRYGDWVG
jgi:hypothetical protein